MVTPDPSLRERRGAEGCGETAGVTLRPIPPGRVNKNAEFCSAQALSWRASLLAAEWCVKGILGKTA